LTLMRFGADGFRFDAPRIAVGASDVSSKGMCERPRRGQREV